MRIWPDLNLAMTAEGEFVEVQGAAERAAFDAEALRSLLALGAGGIRKLMAIQRQALRRGGR